MALVFDHIRRFDICVNIAGFVNGFDGNDKLLNLGDGKVLGLGTTKIMENKRTSGVILAEDFDDSRVLWETRKSIEFSSERMEPIEFLDNA